MKQFFLSLLIVLSTAMFSMAQWSSDPMENNALSLATGEQAIPKVATSESGTTYIAWFSNESGNYNVRLQQMDLFGNVLWEDNGLLISSHPAMTWLTDWDMTVDQDDHAILTFQDIRNGDNDVFAYRISPGGDFIWGLDGVELSTGPAFDAAPKVCVTNSGNTVFAWSADDISILQKISPEGGKLWGDNGITISSSGNTVSWPQLLAVGDDDVILKYFEDSGPVWAPTRHVYAQRYDTDGNAVWTEDAIISNAGGISAWTQVFPFISDGNDGFFIAWHDDRDNDMHSSVFVQHVGEDGQVLLGDDGTEASTQMARQNFYPFLALPPNSEDIYVYWNEMDSDQNNRGIYGQKVSSLGERLWTDNGKAFIEISSTSVYPIAASASPSGMIVFYEKNSSVTEAGITAMLIDEEGEYLWPGGMVDVCGVQSEKVHSVAGTFMFDQWIATWEDDRNGNKDIYAQNIQLDGILGPLPSGPQIEIFPDTLFIEENQMDYYIYVINSSYADYEIDTITYNSEYWFIEDMPQFPYILEPADSLELYIPIYIAGTGGTGMGYIYDTLFVSSSSETKTSIVAFNLDVMPGIAQQKDNVLHVFPNPGSQFSFDLSKAAGNGVLRIFSLSGQVLRQWDCSNSNIIIWDGKNEQGEQLNSGTYLFRFISDGKVQNGKIILAR